MYYLRMQHKKRKYLLNAYISPKSRNSISKAQGLEVTKFLRRLQLWGAEILHPSFGAIFP
jgi:hypothetical protein